MTIHFHCGCGQKLKASDASIGKKFECPVCGTKVTVPETDESAEVAVAAAVAGDAAEAGPVAGDKPAVARHLMPSENGAPKPGAKRKKKSGERDPAPTDDETPSESDTQEIAETDTQILGESDTQERKPERERKPEKTPADSVRRAAVAEELDDEPRSEASYRRNYIAQEAHDASTADTARDLFKLVRKMKRDEPPPEPVKAKKRGKSDEEKFDYVGLLTELGTTVLPGALAIVVLCLGAYWMASSVMSSGRELPELGAVSGVITLDGAPLAGANVMFRPVAEDMDQVSRLSSSVGMTDEEGRYELMYVKDVEGAAVGMHEVLVSLPLPNGKERIPARYNVATKLTFEVEAGGNEGDFALVTK